MHDSPHVHMSGFFPVHHREWEPSAKRTTERQFKRTSEGRILSNILEDALNFVEEIPAQTRSLFLVEGDGLRELGLCLGMKPDYHPNRSRMDVKASSSGMASTPPARISSSLRRTSAIQAASISASSSKLEMSRSARRARSAVGSLNSSCSSWSAVMIAPAEVKYECPQW